MFLARLAQRQAVQSPPLFLFVVVRDPCVTLQYMDLNIGVFYSIFKGGVEMFLFGLQKHLTSAMFTAR
jgi:hypothetical protein